jgi:Holliday junction resolvase RusA-like endonuclease
VKLTILGQTPSKKNSKRIVRSGGRTFLISSKQCLDWEKSAEIQILNQLQNDTSQITMSYPLNVKMFFYRESKRRWDYNNIGQAVLDILVKMKLLIDDDAEHCVPVYEGYEIDKENPRVEVTIW